MRGKKASVEWEENICKFNVWALRASNWVFMMVEEIDDYRQFLGEKKQIVMVFLKKLRIV